MKLTKTCAKFLRKHGGTILAMAFAKKHASGDICGDWECKMISEWTT